MDVLAGLFGDPAVAATLWPEHLGGPRTREQVAQLLTDDLDHWARYGFGPWLFFDKLTAELVGRGGLEWTRVGGTESVEVLYAVTPRLWGAGYATEIASASIQAADRLQLPEVVGFTLTTNRASQRVLEKVGLRYEHDVAHAGLPHWFARRLLRAVTPAAGTRRADDPF